MGTQRRLLQLCFAGPASAPLALRATVATLHYNGDIKTLKPALAMNVILNLLTPTLPGVSLMI
jgi:hypothetical protein